MFEQTLKRLEFDKIVQILAGFTQTGPGFERALALRPLPNDADVVAALAEIDELQKLLETAGAPPISGLHDLRAVFVSLTATGSCLDTETFLLVLSSLETMDAVRNFFSGKKDLPQTLPRIAAMQSCVKLASRIRTSIGSRGEILDSASAELGRIRRSIGSNRQNLRRDLEKMFTETRFSGAFQDQLVTERNGRYVIPVKADFRGKVNGFVHDSSASGQTLYVEPTAALERNNALQTLLQSETAEEQRILQALSDALVVDEAAILVNQEVVVHLDLRCSMARFSRKCNAVVPQLVAEPLIDLRQTRHPLLLCCCENTTDVIPVDLQLGERHSVLMISGPNTGGKTVALKTAGLLVMMVRSGLPIPCHPDSRLHLFKTVFADIGDDQSIENHLSTFAGHLTRIQTILDQADADSLVLIDEAGTGTDPSEGAALILAVLDQLRERGTRAILTTHLNLLKGYAQLRDDVENAAVEFDPQTLRPTYRLHYGIPGESSAFTIARHYGVGADVIARAETYLGEGEQEGRQLIIELNELVRKLQIEKQQTSEQLAAARQDREKRRRLLHEFEAQKQVLLERSVKRGEKLVRNAEREVQRLFEQIPDVKSLPEKASIVTAVKQVGRQLQQETSGGTPDLPPPQNAEVGEHLLVVALGVDGVVTQVTQTKIEIDVQGKRMRLAPDKLGQYAPRRFSVKKGSPRMSRSGELDRFQPRLMLVGKRVDDAVSELTRFLDDALLHDVIELEVVHGAGEGILRRVVREQLAANRSVAAFHAAGPNSGGDNVTVIEMRAS
jgi:DNA mismatch repair protein MutS2